MRPIRLPGRGIRINEALLVDLHEMVEAICKAIQPYTNEPYALFGHGMCALLAHELVLRKVERGEELPDFLCVSARLAPHLGVPVSWQAVSGMSDDEFISVLQRISKSKKIAGRCLPAQALCAGN